MPRLVLPWFLAAFCCLSVFAMAAGTNLTLDDTHTAIIYRPRPSWAVRTSPRHLLDFAYNHTWHEATNGHDTRIENVAHSETSPIALEFNFIGTAIYLYSVQGHSLSTSSLSFVLDGELVSSYSDPADPADPNFFSYWNLPNGEHNIVVNVEPGSMLRFDYLVYTVDPSFIVQPRQAADASQNTGPSTTTDTSPQIGAIAGAIAASVGITSLFSIGLAISIIKIRRQRDRVRRERRAQQDRDRSRGLSIHLPASGAASAHRASSVPRHPIETPASVDPPSYDSVIRLTGRHAIALNTMGPYVAQGPLSTIDEVATARSSQPSLLTNREPPSAREESSAGPPSPPGLRTLSELPSDDTLTVSREAVMPLQHAGARSDHDHQGH